MLLRSLSVLLLLNLLSISQFAFSIEYSIDLGGRAFIGDGQKILDLKNELRKVAPDRQWDIGTIDSLEIVAKSPFGESAGFLQVGQAIPDPIIIEGYPGQFENPADWTYFDYFISSPSLGKNENWFLSLFGDVKILSIKIYADAPAVPQPAKLYVQDYAATRQDALFEAQATNQSPNVGRKQIRIFLDKPQQNETVGQYYVIGGSAQTNIHVQAGSGTFVIPAGATEAFITVYAIITPAQCCEWRSFQVLVDDVNGAQIAKARGTVHLLDNYAAINWFEIVEQCKSQNWACENTDRGNRCGSFSDVQHEYRDGTHICKFTDQRGSVIGQHYVAATQACQSFYPKSSYGQNWNPLNCWWE